jgi:hypothetical protein
MLTWIYFHGSEISEKILQVSRAFLASIGNSSIGNPFQPFARPDFFYLVIVYCGAQPGSTKVISSL